jgi:hypothetical protein
MDHESVPIGEFVGKIDDQILDYKTLEDEGTEVEIYFCAHGNNRYRIVGEKGKPFYNVIHHFDLIEALAQDLNDEKVAEFADEESEIQDEAERRSLEEITEADEIEAEIEMIQDSQNLPPRSQAAIDVLQSVDEEVMERFKYNLFQELSDPMVSTELTHQYDDTMTGFRISRKIFPEDKGFSLTEFNNTVQAVISQGVFGQNTVTSVLVPEIDIADEGVGQR